jgi:hypothetical protein
MRAERFAKAKLAGVNTSSFYFRPQCIASRL